jgi:hypothetical protein
MDYFVAFGYENALRLVFGGSLQGAVWREFGKIKRFNAANREHAAGLQGQRRGGHGLGCEIQLHMRCADLLEAMLHDFERQFWFVAIAAQVAKIKMLQLVGHDVSGAIGGGLVR